MKFLTLLDDNDTMNSIAEIIRNRRTQKTMTGQAVSEAAIRELLELANWAPNHRLNHPWRFTVLTRAGMGKLLEHLRKTLTSEELESFKGPMERVSKAGAVLYVTCVRDAQESIDLENYAAVCCAVQNILLEATARGLQSYWSTGKFFQHPSIKGELQIPETERFVGAIWLGYGTSPAAPPRKPVSDFVRTYS